MLKLLAFFFHLLALSSCSTTAKIPTQSYLQQANQLVKEGFYKESVFYYKKSLLLPQEKIASKRNLGLVYAHLGADKKAIYYLSAVSFVLKQDSTVFHFLGRSYYNIGDHLSAVFYLKKALLQPRADTRYYLAQALLIFDKKEAFYHYNEFYKLASNEDSWKGRLLELSKKF